MAIGDQNSIRGCTVCASPPLAWGVKLASGARPPLGFLIGSTEIVCLDNRRLRPGARGKKAVQKDARVPDFSRRSKRSNATLSDIFYAGPLSRFGFGAFFHKVGYPLGWRASFSIFSTTPERELDLLN